MRTNITILILSYLKDFDRLDLEWTGLEFRMFGIGGLFVCVWVCEVMIGE